MCLLPLNMSPVNAWGVNTTSYHCMRYYITFTTFISSDAFQILHMYRHIY